MRLAIAALIGLAALTFLRLPAPPSARAPTFAAEAPPAPQASAVAPDAIGPDADAARSANARVPIVDFSPSPAAPFHFTGDAATRERARDCLAAAAFYEAGDDPAGERAVIQVVLNRTRHPAFPSSVCAVVFQGAERRSGCQFTFTCDGALTRRPAPAALARARAMAQAALSGAVDPQVGLATHYHADYVAPAWRSGLEKIARQGLHLFYRWPGYWGSAAAFRQGPVAAPEVTVPALAAISAAHAPSMPPIAPPAAAPPPAAMATSAAASGLEIGLDPAANPGSFALKALAICGARAQDCRVTGRIAGNLAFLYVRRGDSEGVFWDCTLFQRPDRNQCLPRGAALERLLAAA
ncbi:cell wall hydrolase [Novosphingobium resinovorum]|nr:cell wall hydrolase [Novosphingobium resinovorum]